MGCLLGCFGGAKDRRRRKRRNSRQIPESQRNRVQNVYQESESVGLMQRNRVQNVLQESESIALMQRNRVQNVLQESEIVALLQRNRVNNVPQGSEIAAEKCGVAAEQNIKETFAIDVVKKVFPSNMVKETSPVNVVKEASLSNIVEETSPIKELRNEPQPDEQLTSSPRKKVAFDSNVTTYDHVSVSESIESLPECNTNSEKENSEDSKKSSQSQSLSEDASSVVSSVGSYPPNQRYHNVRDSDDESEEYGDNDLDDLDDMDEEDGLDDYDENIGDQELRSESILAASMESRTGNPSEEESNEEVQSHMVNTQLPKKEVKEFGSKSPARDRSDYVNSVLNPIENINQWKAAKSKGIYASTPQKENLTSNYESPIKPISSESVLKSKPDVLKNSNQEIAVDASLSNWLVSPEIKSSINGLQPIASGKTISEGSNSAKSFEDRPILGALTVEELKQMAVYSSPKKSPSRSPDDMPIIGTVGTYWNDSTLSKHSGSASSYKGIPNTTSKYREDKRVNWHSTPFETRLDRALNRVSATES